MKTQKIFIEHLHKFIKERGVKYYSIAEILGYAGDKNIQASITRKILQNKQEISVNQLNILARFFRFPSGYFIFYNEESDIQYIDEEAIIKKVLYLFAKAEDEDAHRKKKQFPKYKLGEMIGNGRSKTAQLATVNNLLKRKRNMKISDLFAFSDFFKKPLEWFFKE